MRCKWFAALNVGRLSLEERGFLATVYALGDVIKMPFEDVDEIMGPMWKPLADRLALRGCIVLQLIDGWVYIELKLPKRTIASRMYARNSRKKRGIK